jgi:hypothetical protein
MTTAGAAVGLAGRLDFGLGVLVADGVGLWLGAAEVRAGEGLGDGVREGLGETARDGVGDVGFGLGARVTVGEGFAVGDGFADGDDDGDAGSVTTNRVLCCGAPWTSQKSVKVPAWVRTGVVYVSFDECTPELNIPLTVAVCPVEPSNRKVIWSPLLTTTRPSPAEASS